MIMSSTVEAKRPSKSPFIVRVYRNRGWNVRSRRRAGEVAVPSSEARAKVVITPPLMHVMKYTVPSVLVFATLRYQGKPQALLLEHPASMWCFVAATCLYWLIAGEMKQTRPRRGGTVRFRICRGTALASGILSAAFLVSMLLPRPVSIWIPPSAGVMLYAAFALLPRGIKFVANKMHAAEVEPPSSLPV